MLPTGTTGPVQTLAPPAAASHASSPIPRSWLTVGAIVVGAIVLLSLALYEMRSRDHADAAGTQPVAVPVPVPVPGVANPLDRETRIKAAIHDLEDGATCADRKAAIPKLVELGDDPRSVKALKKARYRMYGGFAGIGESNANACLSADAEAAYKALGGK